MPTAFHRDRRSGTPPPRTGSSETEILRGFLDDLRTSIAAKVDGVPEPQVRTAGVPSGTNLLGLLNHLAFVERSTFLGDEATDWQATFRAAPSDGAADVVARYRKAVERANKVLDRCADLGAPLPRPRPGRHADHADVLRELIDGATGRCTRSPRGSRNRRQTVS